MRAARHAGGESPKRPSPLASPRPSRGRRMSQAGGLSAAGNPRVRLPLLSPCRGQPGVINGAGTTECRCNQLRSAHAADG